jgi:restriction endonuclease Mrr
VVYQQAKRYAPENSIGRQDVRAFGGSWTVTGRPRASLHNVELYCGSIEFVEKIAKRSVPIVGRHP